MSAWGTDPEALRLLEEIEQLKQLAACPAYARLLAPRLRAAQEEHLAALAAPGNPLRAEHVQAYRLATELVSWVEDQLAWRRDRLSQVAPKMQFEDYAA